MIAPESDWVNETIALWTKAGIRLNTGTTSDTIEKVETELQFQFPEDFKELYQVVNGFVDSDWTENMFAIWSLDRIAKDYQPGINHNFPNIDFIGFCDYLIMSHEIGFSKSNEGIFINPGLAAPIALTFRETIKLINEDSELVY